ncbi:response regulator [Janthinobacterium fluminis]|uniref:Response regulator transcription factor n=1 Tax=Janthinobacterium fluminis TaxID=2987524 RepID=A0ABT5JZ60_9BURK|nr:response regulator transcription factor [Janthinobacterium fluminis]MDC8758018.1 response regulator transcription factor [Janthinobacterium fluminis]
MTTSERAIRVMLVDDHKTMLWGLEKLIDGEYPRMNVVGTAGDGDTALALVDMLVPDIIVLDLDLGGRSSIDILPALLANGVSRIVVLSGTRDQDLLGVAVRGGARGVLGKDASAELVLHAIKKVHQGELWLDQAVLGTVLGELMCAKAPPADPESLRIATLTAKERKIVGMIAMGSGALNKAIAQRALIAENTLRNHLTSIYQKLGVSNRLELYVYATRHGLGDGA